MANLYCIDCIYRIYSYKCPGGNAFFKRGGGVLLQIQKLNSRVKSQWAKMDTYSLELACQPV